MATDDQCCTICPYFKIHAGQSEAFHNLVQRFVEASSREPKCLYYGFSFSGDEAHCREGYEDAEALLFHAEHVRHLIDESMGISDLTRLEIHGPETELAKLREPLAEFDPQFFVLQYGFRR